MSDQTPNPVLDKSTGEADGSNPPRFNLHRSIVLVLLYTYGAWFIVVMFALLLNLDPSVEVLVAFLLDTQNNFTGGSETTFFVFSAWVALVVLPLAAASAAHVVLRMCKIEERAARYLNAALPIVCLGGYGAAFIKVLGSPEVAALRETGDPKLDLNVFTVVGLWVFLAVLVAAVYAVAFLIGPRVTALLDDVQQRFDTAQDNLLRSTSDNQLMQFLKGFVSGFFHNTSAGKARSDLVRGLKSIVVLVVGILVFAAYVGFFEPDLATRVGPVGLAASFCTIAIVILSAWTALSNWMPGNTPIILLTIPLMIATGGAWLAFGAAVVFVIALGFSMKYAPQRKLLSFTFFGGFAALSASYIFAFWNVPECKTLAGCNMITGVETDHAPLDTLPEPGGDGPIRVVAAQGGGLYAAYHTAYYLAHRTDEEPGFAESLYALSGVSGGSVGSGVYWAVRASGVCPLPTEDQKTECHRAAVREILEQDYLSPSLATLLFRDLFDTFIPVSSFWHWLGLGPIDRGKVMEDELKARTQAWFDRVTAEGKPPDGARAPQDLLQTALPSSAAIGGAASLPLLFFNSTQVDTGEKVVLSAVTRVNGTQTALPTASGAHLTVLNGMVISARFPLVTPPARVSLPPTNPVADPFRTVQLVDGGYFDNSGIETAMDVILELRGTTERPVELISFLATAPAQPVSPKGALGAPLSAFLNAWRARSAHSEARVDEVLGSATLRCQAHLDTGDVNFTLSWFLSQATYENVRDQITDNPVCYQ